MAKSLADKLKAAGIDAGRGVITYAPPESLSLFHDPNDVMYDLRIERPLEEPFIEDLYEHGVHTPVAVRSNGLAKGGVPILQVIYGQRRVRHLREANKRRVKEGLLPHPIGFLTVSGSDGEMLLLRQSENSQRVDDSLREKAHRVRALHLLKVSKTAIAQACKFGRNTGHVDELLAYWDLTPEAQAVFERGELPRGNILTLADVPREQQAEVLASLKMNNATKTHEVAEAVEAAREGKPYTPPDRKRAWGRREMKAFNQTLELMGLSSKEVIVAKALTAFYLGDAKALADLPTLKTAATEVNKTLRKHKRTI